MAVGADGLLVEVHHQPEQALSDGYQSLLPDQFQQLMEEISQIGSVLRRSVARAAGTSQSLRAV